MAGRLALTISGDPRHGPACSRWVMFVRWLLHGLLILAVDLVLVAVVLVAGTAFVAGIDWRAPVTHMCRPGFEIGEPMVVDGVTYGRRLTMVHCRPGDVWECDCGKRYEAKDSPRNYATVGSRTSHAVEWWEIRPPRRHWWKR